jgi:hypothetical protein
MRPICAKCCTAMRCTKNSRAVEIMSDGKPYQLWYGDEWGCDGCGALIVTGFGRGPIAEAYRANYASVVASERDYGTIVMVEK